MKITKRQLKRIIREEYSSLQAGHGMGSMHMAKAEACCSMAPDMLLGMCADICEANRSNASECVKLCACVSTGDVMGCCKCLDIICSCPKCHQICSHYCGC